MVRWGGPLALAASVVVVVSLVFEPSMQREISQSAVPAAPPKPASSPAPVGSVMNESAPLEMRVPQSDKASSEAADSGGSEPLQERFAEVPDQQSFALETEQKVTVQAEQSRNQMASAARRAATPPSPPMEAPVDRAPTNAIRQTTSVAPPPASPAPSLAPEADAESSGAADSNRSDELQDIVATAQRREQANASAGAGPRGTIPFANARKEAESDSDKVERTAPATWLEHIRELRRAGRTSDADREWERFVKQYPDYVVDAADMARPPKK